MDPTPKLLAFDLDGTLTESKSPMTPEMGTVLAQLLHKMPVAVMSGAAFHQFENEFLHAMPPDANFKNLYLFPTNAAQCFVWRGLWKQEYSESLTDNERQKILTALDESLKETNFVHPPRVWGKQVEDREAQITFSALGQEAPIEEKRKWDPTREKRKPVYDALLKKLPDFSIGLNATTSIDITRRGINKAYGVKKLVRLTGISINDMLYVGDALAPGGNDAVVKESGVATRQVSGPQETAELIEHIVEGRAAV